MLKSKLLFWNIEKKQNYIKTELLSQKYLPLIKLKGIREKWNKTTKEGKIDIKELNKKYNKYIFVSNKLDQMKSIEKEVQEWKIDNINQNMNHNFINNNVKIIKLMDNKNKNKYFNSKTKIYAKYNILNERNKNIVSRNMYNKLLTPNYFFTRGYNEGNTSSQIKHWTSSIYNFIKDEKSGNNYLDKYTNKIIKLFFNRKYTKRKKIWNIKLLDGYKIKPNISVIKDINLMVKYTSNRTSWSLKKLVKFSTVILTSKWIMDQIKFSFTISKMIIERKTKILSGYIPKKKDYSRKLKRVLISKPLYKHTPFNLIIDLFIYNNKKYKIRKLENIISRRTLYKYMYSMYANTHKKIKETIGRPYFFYMNLIEPKIFTLYSNIIKSYENLLLNYSKTIFIYICIFILKWNNIKKKYIQINNIQKIKIKSNNKYKEDTFNTELRKYYLFNEINNTFSVNIKENRKTVDNKGKWNKLDQYKEDKKVFFNNNKFNNSKMIWDKLDDSLIKMLNSKISVFNKNGNIQFKLLSLNWILRKIDNIINYNDIWYLIYYINIIKYEFYRVNKDVLISKNLDVIKDENKKEINNNYDLNWKRILQYKKNKDILYIHIWPSYKENNIKENINLNLGYNENLFKPYYRYIIPMYIYESYKLFLSYFSYKNILSYLANISYINNKLIRSNNFIIFNFIIVKTLLDLLHYNYRSLINLKPKYYYLNKLRHYKSKIRRLDFNTWIASVKYIKKLRKTPRYFWRRYHKVASFYFNRIVQNSELDTKRKTIVPFVLYFEDILFSIYGKWVVIRLWPIKNYFLNSFILAERISTLINWRHKKIRGLTEFQKVTRKLIATFKFLQIKKLYNYNNNSKWPINLVNIMKEDESLHSLSYNNLEFFDKKGGEEIHILNAYLLNKYYISLYLSPLYHNYKKAFIQNIKSIKHQKTKRNIIRNINGYKINKIKYVFYWLRPINNYLLKMKRYLDISGIKFRLTGRLGVKRSNLRSFSKTLIYGNLFGPNYFSPKLKEDITTPIPYFRNTIRSTIDYAFKVTTGTNGSISLKIWISSSISSDTHELLLHLIEIKYLYTQLLNRYYIVKSNFVNIKNNYLYNSVNKNVNISGKKRYIKNKT